MRVASLESLQWDQERHDMMVVSDWIDRKGCLPTDKGIADMVAHAKFIAENDVDSEDYVDPEIAKVNVARMRLRFFWTIVFKVFPDHPEFKDISHPMARLQRAFNYLHFVEPLDKSLLNYLHTESPGTRATPFNYDLYRSDVYKHIESLEKESSGKALMPNSYDADKYDLYSKFGFPV